MLTDEQAQTISTGALRARAERLANYDDELAEILRRGYRPVWEPGLKACPRLSLVKDGVITHGPGKGLPATAIDPRRTDLIRIDIDELAIEDDFDGDPTDHVSVTF